MNGAEYIDFAAKIAVTYSSAAGCRSAVSRAYYGAFHVAKAFLAKLGSRPPRNANAHAFVQHRLLNCGHAQAVEAGRLLTDLHKDRLTADYDMLRTHVEDVEYVRDDVIAAQAVQRSIESCDTDEIRQEIKAGIAEYERRISGA
jgi:uncharacterized protein (UPF0332 family)